MRRTSVSLPTKHVARDPHEKPGRYESGYAHQSRENAGILERIQAAWMNQAQKTRWLKTTAIVVFLIFLFYYLSPKGVNVYPGGMSTP